MASVPIGYAKAFLGSMFSGKTSQMLQELKLQDHCGRRCLFISYDGSERPELADGSEEGIVDPSGRPDGVRSTVVDLISTHNTLLKTLPATIPREKAKDAIGLMLVNVLDVDVIGLDEFQFFPGVRGVVDQWLRLGKYVFLAGLDSDFKMQPFADTLAVLSVVDDYIKLRAVCVECVKEGETCRREASFNFRVTADTEQIVVGGKDKYIPLCRLHYQKLTQERK